MPTPIISHPTAIPSSRARVRVRRETAYGLHQLSLESAAEEGEARWGGATVSGEKRGEREKAGAFVLSCLRSCGVCMVQCSVARRGEARGDVEWSGVGRLRDRPAEGCVLAVFGCWWVRCAVFYRGVSAVLRRQ
jgi:hypothetical protein